MKDNLIRGRLIVRIRDSALSEQLQLNANLTLDDAVKQICQREVVHEHQNEIQQGDSKHHHIVVDAVREKRTQRRLPSVGKQSITTVNAGRAAKPGKKNCSRCGGSPHAKKSCPAYNATCRRCRKKGHYASMCFSKRTSTECPKRNVDTTRTRPLEQYPDDSHLDMAYLDTAGIYTEQSSNVDALGANEQRCWTAKVTVSSEESNVPITFKLNTRAEVTAILDTVHRTLNTLLEQPSKILYGLGRSPLHVLGQCRAILTYHGRSTLQQLFVIKELKNNLLGLPAITALNLAVQVDSTAPDSLNSTLTRKYPSLFQGLGNMGEAYQIQLIPNHKPHVLYTPRRVPLPLRAKVKEELNRMESLGVISKVEELSTWCADMVAVPKRNGDVRICVDLRPLNRNVMREIHLLPKVDDILTQISGAAIFSKLDANSGFWQVPLAPASRHLTTFITHFGLTNYHSGSVVHQRSSRKE